MKNSPIRNVFSLITDVIYVSFLTFFTSLLTAFIAGGAALKGSYNVMFKLFDNERATYVFKEFKDSIIKDFVQVTITWVCIVLVGFGLFLTFNYANNTDSVIMLVLVYAAGVELLLFTSYYFPIVAVFESPNYMQSVKNTILMVHGHPGVSIRLLGTVVFVLYLVLYVNSFFLFLGIPVYLFFNTAILRKTFSKYIELTRGESNEVSEF